MPRIFPARISNGEDGFSLIEVIVAVAVAAMTVAAAASAILVSQKIETAAFFYRDAFMAVGSIQASAYGIAADDDEMPLSRTDVTVEEETITRDAQGKKPAWTLYHLRSADADRQTAFAIKTGTAE